MVKINTCLPSFCTSNEDVIETIICFCKKFRLPILIESTSNQVNQFGGYSKLTPSQFKLKIEKIASKHSLNKKEIIFGGDHLGPLPWNKYNNKLALRRGSALVKLYIKSNFKKIHVDTTMKLKNDKSLNKKKIKDRTKTILRGLKNKRINKLIFVLGSEVPPAGGEKFKRKYKNNLFNEIVEEVKLYKSILKELKLSKELNLVVDTGMSFTDNKVYSSKKNSLKLLNKISKQMRVKYEAHSTDYQSLKELKKLRMNNFKYLKVGPELTYYFTKAILLMSKIEDKYFKNTSEINKKIFETLEKKKQFWIDYYPAKNLKKVLYGKFDRLRYYWNEPIVIKSKKKLYKNINKLEQKLIFKELGIKNKSLYSNTKYNDNSKIIINSFLYKSIRKYYRACNYNI